jgi:hypothetical protein
MSRRNEKTRATTALEYSLVLNFMRLCAEEGVDSASAYRELDIRLDALSQLKPPT